MTEDFNLTRPQVLAMQGDNERLLDDRTVTCNQVPPDEIARIRRAGLVPALRPRWRPHLGMHLPAPAVSAQQMMALLNMTADELMWRMVCAVGMLERDVLKLRTVELVPYWVTGAQGRVTQCFSKTQTPQVTPQERRGMIRLPSYRGFHAIYSPTDFQGCYQPITKLVGA